MNPEEIIATWLGDSTITALVGDRSALSQLPANSIFPAIVYNIVDSTPQPNVAAQGENELAQCRIQLNPVAKTIPEIKNIANALRVLLDFKHNVTIASKTVVSMRLLDMGPLEKDNDSGLFTQRYDYRMFWYET